MPKGWQQASTGNKTAIRIEFECDNCGHEFIGTGEPGMFCIRRRLLAGVQNSWKAQCSECGTFCETIVEDIPEPSSTKPTKRLIVGDELYHVHGRDRSVVPADIKEVIDNAMELIEESYGKEKESGRRTETPADGDDNRTPVGDIPGEE